MVNSNVPSVSVHFNPSGSYRWNPYGGDSVRDETLVIPIINDDIDPSQWLFERCPPEAMPPDPIQIFIGQMFNPEPKRVLAVVARTTGVRMYSPKVIPRRGMYATVFVAREDAPKLLRHNKKMQCEVTPSGERVVRVALQNDEPNSPPISPPPIAGPQRQTSGVPQGPMVIELSMPSSINSRRSSQSYVSPTPVGGSDTGCLCE